MGDVPVEIRIRRAINLLRDSGQLSMVLQSPGREVSLAFGPLVDALCEDVEELLANPERAGADLRRELERRQSQQFDPITDDILQSTELGRTLLDAGIQLTADLQAAQAEIEWLREQVAAADALADAVQWLSPDPVPYPELNRTALRVVEAYHAYRATRGHAQEGGDGE